LVPASRVLLAMGAVMRAVLDQRAAREPAREPAAEGVVLMAALGGVPPLTAVFMLMMMHMEPPQRNIKIYRIISH
jgi:hypothetical protein